MASAIVAVKLESADHPPRQWMALATERFWPYFHTYGYFVGR
jgi:hypothetical protein